MISALLAFPSACALPKNSQGILGSIDSDNEHCIDYFPEKKTDKVCTAYRSQNTGLLKVKTEAADSEERDICYSKITEFQKDSNRVHQCGSDSLEHIRIESATPSIVRISSSLAEGASDDDDYTFDAPATPLRGSEYNESDLGDHDGNFVVEMLDTEEDIDDSADEGAPGMESGSPRRKRKKWIKGAGIGRVAKTVKTGTTMTGKQVVKQGKKVGKGTVIAGRAIISKSNVHLHRPPGREPRKRVIKQIGKDHHVAVNKAIRLMKNSSVTSPSAQVTAGELSAPDQSCRVVSQVLSDMSSLLCISPSSQISDMIASQMETKSELDCWFLCGGSVELGVIPMEEEKLVHGSLVARSLWESHWREEWCGLYDSRLVFYAPLSKRPALTLFLVDVQSVRRLDPSNLENPLPGLSFLAVDTAWRCHYLAFIDTQSRDKFADRLHTSIFAVGGEGILQNDVWKAHLWQGFQTSAQSSLSEGRGKWAPISSSSKRKQRKILNCRRMCFDLESFTPLPVTEQENEFSTTNGLQRAVSSFVENMLTMALSFSYESLDPNDFICFLDMTSRLRSIPLHKLDLSGCAAFCIFVNIYHCLLQHALLLEANGPPNKVRDMAIPTNVFYCTHQA